MISRGRVGMIGLIVAEASLFAVFVVAYLYDLGKNPSGPSPGEGLSVPLLGTVCLLSVLDSRPPLGGLLSPTKTE